MSNLKAIELVKDKTPSWVHERPKKKLIEFLSNFKKHSIYGFFLVEDLRKIFQKGQIELHDKPDQLTKEELIEKLLKYEYEEVLELATIDCLRKVTKEVIENVKTTELQKLAEKLRAEENQKSVIEQQQQPNSCINSKVIISEVTSESDEMGDRARMEFSLHKDDWETFIEQLEMFFEAKDIKEEKKKAQLLVHVDTEAFKLIKQLIAPGKINEKSYEEVVKCMNEHLNPKPSEVMERCNFHLAKQNANNQSLSSQQNGKS